VLEDTDGGIVEHNNLNLTANNSTAHNCHDNTVAKSFFATIKKRIIKRKIHSTRNDAKADIFNFIEMFYNPKKLYSSV